MLGIILISVSCANDDKPVAIEPTSDDAAFTFAFDAENPNRVIFTANPNEANWYTHWDFGDNTSAEGYEASKMYFDRGDYDVRFKVFTEGGTAESIQTVVINEDLQAPNLIQNGEFNGSDPWIVLPISDGVNVSFDNNEAHWTGGSWGQVGIYQPIQVLANNEYQISMDIRGGPLSDSWFEVYVGMETPVPGQDYTDGGMRLALNTWEGCGGEPFEGDFSGISCVGSGATFEFPTAGTAYLVIRGGGSNYGPEGVAIDNVAIRSLESFALAAVAGFTFETSDLTASFTNTSTNATSYSWDFGDGSGTSTEENPSYTYAAGGTYSVTLTASNDTESSEITQELTVTDPGAAPVAGFTVETSNLTATFTNTSTNATSYSWDFGDGSGTSSEVNPSYTYAAEGTYTVTLIATNDASVSDEFTSEVMVEAAVVTNLIVNGAFDDESAWSIIQHNGSGNGVVTISDGVAVFDEITDIPSGSWGNEAHVGINQAVTVEAGDYFLDMNITTNGIDELWFEVWVGTEAPVEGSDYGADQGAERVLAVNAWDCADTKTYSGSMAATNCNDEDGTITLEANTYYVVIRSGGFTFGDGGVIIDDVTMVEVN